MTNVLANASVIPHGVETMSGARLTVYPLTAMVTNYLATVVTGGSFNLLGRRWPFFFGRFGREFDMRLHLVFRSSGII